MNRVIKRFYCIYIYIYTYIYIYMNTGRKLQGWQDGIRSGRNFEGHVTYFPISRQGRPQYKFNDDVIKWKHFPRYWPFVRGIHRSPVNSTHKGQWRGALMFSSICAWINAWVNNRKTGDSRHHRAHYDVIVMFRTAVICRSQSNSKLYWRNNNYVQKSSVELAQLHAYRLLDFWCIYVIIMLYFFKVVSKAAIEIQRWYI